MLGHPASRTLLLVTTARLLRTTFPLSTPVDTSPAPSPPVSPSVPPTQNIFVHKRWKHYQDNQVRSILTLSHSRQRSFPGSPPWKVLMKLLLQLQTRCRKETVQHCHELSVWQVLWQNRTLKHNPT